MKQRLFISFLLLIFLIGFSIMAYPFVSNLLYQHQSTGENEEYDANVWGLSADACAALWTAAKEYNQRLAQKPDQFSLTEQERAEVAEYLNPLGIGKMGYITIPKIGVEIPIYQGTEEKELQAGAGWWIGTSLPTGGEGTHCVLTAHNGLVKAKLFTDLDRLVVGDRFYLTVLDQVLTYAVDQIQVIEPEEREALRLVPGEDLVTLYTCTPYGVNTHRLLVRGHRVESLGETAYEGSGGVSWWPLLALLLLIGVCLRVFFSKKAPWKGERAKNLIRRRLMR